MGHQITAGDQEIAYSLGAWLVVRWCERITPPVKPAAMTTYEWAESRMGSTDISAEAARRADSEIPMDFKAAWQCGYCEPVVGRGDVTQSDFDVCRAFLRYAAERGLPIVGGW